MKSRTLLILALLAGGCSFSPKFTSGTIACKTDKDCPPSFRCLQLLCYQLGTLPDGGGGAGMGGAGGGSAGTGGMDAAADQTVAGDHPQDGAGADAGDTRVDVPPTDGGGDAGCAAVCAAGDKRCGTFGLQTCVMVGGCPAWGQDVVCPGRQTCQGSAPRAACTCPAAPSGCEGGKGKVCMGTAPATSRSCSVDGEGCVFEDSATPCTSGKPCMGSFPTGVCTCPAPEAICGNGPGTFCQSDMLLQTCGNTSDGCLAVTRTTHCDPAKPCRAANGVATCSCTNPPAECAAGAGGFCRANGNLVTCDLDGSGCLAITGDAPCASGLTCQGTAPGASCRCPAPPAVCTGSGTFCQGNTLVTCGNDTNGCLVARSSTGCPGAQVCTGNAGTARCACPALPAQCPGGAGKLCDASGNLVSCVADGNGCVTVASSGPCGNATACSGAFPAAACGCPATPAICSAEPGTYCSGNAVVTCTRNATSGCVTASQPVACGSGLGCGGTAGQQSCRCASPPAACMGVTSGNVCQSQQSYVTCGLNDQNCVVITNANGTCPGGSKPCAGNPGAAACTCNTSAPTGCTMNGTFTPGSFCTGTAAANTVTSCVADGNGCPTGSVTDCRSPRACTGSAPNVTCQCEPQWNQAQCVGGSSDRCQDSSTQISCTDLGFGCHSLNVITCPPGQGCSGTDPTARCVDEIVYGFPKSDGLGNSEAWSERFMAIPFNISVPTTLRRLGLLWAGDGTGSGVAFADVVMMGIYPDGPGPTIGTRAPVGKLLAGVSTLNVDKPGNFEGKITLPVAGEPSVPAGNYWLLINIRSQPSTGFGLGSVARIASPESDVLMLASPFAKGLPTDIPAGTAFTTFAFKGPLNVYVVGLPQF